MSAKTNFTGPDAPKLWRFNEKSTGLDA